VGTHRRATGQKPEVVTVVRMPNLNLEFSGELQVQMTQAAEEAAMDVYYAALGSFYREQNLRRLHGLRLIKRILPRHLAGTGTVSDTIAKRPRAGPTSEDRK